MAAEKKPAKDKRKNLPYLDPNDAVQAFDRLVKLNAHQLLVRGAFTPEFLRGMLKNALPKRSAADMPPESWAGLAAGFGVENVEFAAALGQALHDQLSWDKEPATEDAWWEMVRDRPLEAMWMAALSDNKWVRKELKHIVTHCVENHRQSPDCLPPTWGFVDSLLELQALSDRDLRDALKRAEDLDRRQESELVRQDELREELRKLRRENAELRAQRAQAERSRNGHPDAHPGQAAPAPPSRLEELERKVRKLEKEREHLERELARAREPEGEERREPEPAERRLGEAPAPAVATSEATIAHDDNPRRRLLRQMLRKLVSKGKIGASHTHEDNVYRGVADHQKGEAKELMDLLYLEGFFVPKTTVADPHVSLHPARMPEVQAIIAGEVSNARLQRFLETEAS